MFNQFEQHHQYGPRACTLQQVASTIKGVNSTISFKQPSGACLESGLIGRNRREVVIPVYGYESVWTGMEPKELINTTRTVSYPRFARSQHWNEVMSSG